MRGTSFDLPALMGVVPSGLVGTAIRKAGRQSKRLRKLPDLVVFWLVVGMGLERGHSIPRVLSRVARALGDVVRWGRAERPHSTSIAKARDRLGWELVRTVFRQLAELFAGRFGSADMRWGLRVLTLDGTTFRTADMPSNAECFGRPSSTRGGGSAFPQLRALMLVGAFSHLLAHVAMRPYCQSELLLAEDMIRFGWIRSGMLLLLDRGFYSFVWAARIRQAGAHFLMRAQTGRHVLKPQRLHRLGPNDWLCEILNNGRRNQRGHPGSIVVRVITRQQRGFRPVTLMTSLLDPKAFPGDEVFQLYADRWEAELTYRELKSELAGSKVPFRCATPGRVLQEAYGLFLAYNCVRALMCEAAESVRVEPRALSFTEALECVHCTLMDASPREGWAALHDQLVAEISLCLLPPRRQRSCPRAVKSLFVRYPRKKADGTTGRTRRQLQRARAYERHAAIEAAR